jgi:multidrug efflux pump subunit AcrA (membrane-fusion protein)
VLRIPTQTLLQGGRVLVYASGVLEERFVEVGLRNWNFVEIKEGLSLGDAVVTSLDNKDVVAEAKAEIADEEDADSEG